VVTRMVGASLSSAALLAACLSLADVPREGRLTEVLRAV
jgi:hypothetical protein